MFVTQLLGKASTKPSWLKKWLQCRVKWRSSGWCGKNTVSFLICLRNSLLTMSLNATQLRSGPVANSLSMRRFTFVSAKQTVACGASFFGTRKKSGRFRNKVKHRGGRRFWVSTPHPLFFSRSVLVICTVGFSTMPMHWVPWGVRDLKLFLLRNVFSLLGTSYICSYHSYICFVPLVYLLVLSF